MSNYTPHPAAELFPMMPPDQYEAFKEDVRKNGFQQDITLYKGEILDGRNRYKAAIELDMLDELPICEIDDDTNFDPYQWVISRNLHRRHLNESQRSMVAAKLAKLQVGDNQHRGEVVSIDTPSIEKAAEQLQVGRATVARAKSVLANGSPELIQAVEQGEVAVSKAARVAKEVPKEKQLEVAKEKPSTRKDDGKPQPEQRDIDQEAVEDFLRCRSRLNRIKKLLKELNSQEVRFIADWIENCRDSVED